MPEITTFTWTTPSGASITIPRAGHLKAGTLRKIRRLSPVDAMFTMLENVADEETLAAVDELEMGDLNDLWAAWQEDSSLGESSGSSS